MNKLAVCLLALSQLHHLTNFELHGAHTHCVARNGDFYEVLPDHEIHAGGVTLAGIDYVRHHQHGDCAICSALRTGLQTMGLNHTPPPAVVVFSENSPAPHTSSHGPINNRGPPTS